MSWIDDINKKLEEQRASFKEARESGETFRRKQAYGGIFGAEKAFNDDQRRESWNKFVESDKFKPACSKGGKTQGNRSVESGHMERIRKISQENRYNRTIESYKEYLAQFDEYFTGTQFWGGDATKAFKGNALKHLLSLNLITKLARNQYKKNGK